MSNPKKVTRVLAKGKKLKLTGATGERVRHTGPKKVQVTEAQAEAFKSHWRVKEVELDEGDDATAAPAKSQAILDAEVAVNKAKGELAKKPEDAALKLAVTKAEAALAEAQKG